MQTRSMRVSSTRLYLYWWDGRQAGRSAGARPQKQPTGAPRELAGYRRSRSAGGTANQRTSLPSRTTATRWRLRFYHARCTGSIRNLRSSVVDTGDNEDKHPQAKSRSASERSALGPTTRPARLRVIQAVECPPRGWFRRSLSSVCAHCGLGAGCGQTLPLRRGPSGA